MITRLLDHIQTLRVTLWTLIAPPLVWAAHFLFSYLWASVLCAKLGAFATEPWLFWGCTVLALVVIVGCGVIAHIQSRVPGDKPPHEQGTKVDRLRFLAYSTLLLAGLSFIGVIFTAMPVLFITDCR